VTVTVIQLHPRTDDTNIDPSDTVIFAPVPLAQCQICDVVASGGQSLGKVSVPPLGTAHGVGEQAVVNHADTQDADEIRISWPAGTIV
jgi:hypothetical protein